MILPELMKSGAVEIPVCIALRVMDGGSLDTGNRVMVLREVLRINRSVGLRDKRILYQYSAFFYHMIKSRLFRRIG